MLPIGLMLPKRMLDLLGIIPRPRRSCASGGVCENENGNGSADVGTTARTGIAGGGRAGRRRIARLRLGRGGLLDRLLMLRLRAPEDRSDRSPRVHVRHALYAGPRADGRDRSD